MISMSVFWLGDFRKMITLVSQTKWISWTLNYHIRPKFRLNRSGSDVRTDLNPRKNGSEFFHALRHLRPVITDEVAKTIACLFVTSHLDYTNSVLNGISAKNHRLQRMQNALAWVILSSSAAKFSHSTDMLCYLHWLPVQYHIQFKLLAFNAYNNNTPLYLSCLLHNYVPGHSLRSSQSNLLCVPSHKLNFGALSFRLLYGTHFLQTFVHVHFMALLPVGWKLSILIMLFSMLLGPLWLPAPLIQCFILDFVCITNCFYDYDYDYYDKSDLEITRKTFSFVLWSYWPD